VRKTHFRCRDKHKSGLTIVEITVVSGLVVALGILLLYVASSWYFGSALEATEEVDKNVQMIRSALMIEKIVYDYSLNKANMTIRNVARDNMSLRIIAVDLVTMDNRIVGYKNLLSHSYVLRQGEKIVIEDVPTCDVNQCHKGDLLRYRVWYVPERYADGQSSMPGKATFIESPMIYAGGELFLACPPPRDYVVIDIVDPLLLTDGQFSPSNTVYIRPAISGSGSSSTIDIMMYVETLDDGTWGFGGANGIEIPSPGNVKVTGNFSGIKVPFKILIHSPDMEVIPREFVMGGSPNKVFVSGVTFLWRETDYMVHTIVVEVGARPLSEDVLVKVSVKVLDCLDNTLAEVEAAERVPSGMDVDLPVFIKLPKPVRFDQIYSVEAEIMEVE